MNAGKTAKYGEIINNYVSCQCCIIGKNCVVAYDTIMRDMYVGHYPVIIANYRFTTAVIRTPVNATKLTDYIMITNFKC